jgi:hypothetical protein
MLRRSKADRRVTGGAGASCPGSLPACLPMIDNL